MRFNGKVAGVLILGATLAACSSTKGTSSTTASAEAPRGANVAQNKTGLPSYPSLSSGAMLPPFIPGYSDPKHPPPCPYYNELTKDQPADVVAWYRNALPGATEGTITFDVVDGKNIPATDFHVNGTGHVTITAWSANDSNTRMELWSDQANCKVPGM
jgi:hypothetical protein